MHCPASAGIQVPFRPIQSGSWLNATEVPHAIPYFQTLTCRARARHAPGRGLRRSIHWGIRRCLTATPADLCPTPVSGRRLHVDTRLLGLGTRRILLGAWNLGTAAPNRIAVDPGVLGLDERGLHLACGVLGTERRILRRYRLRLRIRRLWLRRRILERRDFLLQSGLYAGQPRNRGTRILPTSGIHSARASCQFQWRPGRGVRPTLAQRSHCRARASLRIHKPATLASEARAA